MTDLIKDNGCFVCGPQNERGLRTPFDLDRASHTASGRLVIPEWAQGWRGVTHGGILSTLLDEACAHAGRTVGPHPVTAELSVRFLKPVPVEAEVVVFGEVLEVKKRVVEARARLEIGGEIHAEAQARIILVRPPE